MSRVEEYRAHISGPHWKEIRRSALQRTDGLCGFCGSLATQVHHVRYPKRFSDDGPQNTVPACERCHALAHGGVTMKLVAVDHWYTELSPAGAELRYAVIEGMAFASCAYWREALTFPHEAQFAQHVESACNRAEGRGFDARRQERGGDVLIRWHCVADAMRHVDRKFHSKDRNRLLPPCVIVVGNGVKVDAWARWMDRFEDLLWWGYGLQEKALTAQGRVARATSADQHLAAFLGEINQTVKDHGDTLVVHSSEIERLGQQVWKNPEEFILARTYAIERGLEPSAMPLPGNRRNWEELLGAGCAKYGADRGPDSPRLRISGTSLEKQVSTWRRRDLEAAYNRVILHIATNGPKSI